MNKALKAAALFILSAAASLADPAWKAELTPPAPGPHPRLAPTTLDYRLSWKGIFDSGKLRIEFAPPAAKKKAAYVVRSSSSSIGAASILFPYQADFWSELDPSDFKPRYFHAIESDDKESTETSVRHYPDRVEARETTKTLKTGVSGTEDKIFRFAPVFDIFSAMLHVRSQKLDPGDHVTLVICPFKTPYLLRIHVEAREIHDTRPAIRLSVAMQKIDRTTLELLPYKKLKGNATFWLTADPDRIPLEFRAAAYIGDVRATLTATRKP